MSQSKQNKNNNEILVAELQDWLKENGYDW